MICRIELIVDNRVNRSTLSANGIRNAVSLQPILYIGGMPATNNFSLAGSGLNSYGFQGCLASFVVDGHLLDYQTALIVHGQVKTNVCSGKRFLPFGIERYISEKHSIDPLDITSNTKHGKRLSVVLFDL